MNELDMIIAERAKQYIRDNVSWTADHIANRVKKEAAQFKFKVINDGMTPYTITIDVKTGGIGLSYEILISYNESKIRTQYIGNFYKDF